MRTTCRNVLVSCLVCAFILALPAAGELRVEAVAEGMALSLTGQTPFHVTVNEVQNEREVAVPDSATVLVLWDEMQADGQMVSYYAISLDGQQVNRVTATDYAVKLRHERFDPVLGEPVVRAGLDAGVTVRGSAGASPSQRGSAGASPSQRGSAGVSPSHGGNVYLVQFVTQPLGVFRTQIEELGGTIRHFMTSHTYIVEMSPAARDAVARLPYVRWVGPYHPAYRLEECLRYMPTSGKEAPDALRCNIQVFEPGMDQKLAVAERISSLGGYVNRSDAGKYLLEATLTPSQVHAVAGWDEVCFVDRWGPYELDMNNAREYGGSNYLESNSPPPGYTGQDVRGEAYDAGFNLSHVDFASRPLIIHNSAGSDSHGAATSGICFGDGTGDPNARGLLPSAQGIVSDYYDTLGEPTRYAHTGDLIQPPYFGVFQTSSVGSPRTFYYTTISADTDSALFDFDVIHCQSQSNAGNQDSRPQAWAKNIISGGGVYHYDTLDPGDDCWCSGASTGPAQDGRIKPDLCGYYDDILTTSTGSTTAYTTSFGGTSGATPIVCGHVGLFFQMWSEGIFGNEVDPLGSVFDNRAHMTTAKAMAINNAQQYPFTGAGHDLTRVHQGWGWSDLARMYDMREKTFIIDESEILTNMTSVSYALNVEAGEPDFRATLVYADPAGDPAAAEARINDLTLKVTAPNGDYYWGNHGLLENMYSVPNAGLPNTVDTVENVLIQNPIGGLWVIEVFADEIVQDGHVETGDLDADFALVISGVSPCLSAGTIRLDSALYPCSDVAEIRVLDCDLNIDDYLIDTVTVTIESTSEPMPESVVLMETGLATASFIGTIPLETTNSPGVLWVAHGDAIVATYIDEDDGQGNYDVVVTATATVDCVSPTISNVQSIDVEPRSAKVTFDADELVRGTVYYGLSCGSLTETAMSGMFSMTPVVSLTGLQDNMTYFYTVEAEDQAGNTATDDNGGACYSFTTPEVPDFFTEQNPGDLDGLTLFFV
ncbi:MAG: S8 family serine peptidase, partial [Phycisphaerae bacterium]|nr:S8 family serine peptidase [Phycisphaerae bacterium]